MRTKTPRQARPADLPPIPGDTPEGIRLLAIAETIRVLDGIGYGLELQTDDVRVVARRLGVPALFFEAQLRVDTNCHDEHVAEYVAWRQQLAGKAVP